jgi:threonine dehydrogenase-like Zn-dependent dehydrogenase
MSLSNKQQAVAFTAERTVGFLTEDWRELGPDDVRLRTLYSGISTGTELTAYRGTNQYLTKLWDNDLRLFKIVPSAEVPEHNRTSISWPVIAWGYEECGEVIEVGSNVHDIPVGTIIFGTWGHRTHHIVPAWYARERKLAAGVDAKYGIFSQIGAIALNGILDSRLVLGETVAIFGLGVVGLLTAQLAKLAGAYVIGVDMLESRRNIALQCGIDHVLDPSSVDAAERIKQMTNRRGADVVFESSGNYHAYHQAIRAAAYSSRVIAQGFYQGEARGLFLGDEAHHNRINIVVSQISGVAPELQHRWNELRLQQTFMRFVGEHRLRLEPMITHVVPASEAGSAFAMLDQRPQEALQVILDFRNGLAATPETMKAGDEAAGEVTDAA